MAGRVKLPIYTVDAFTSEPFKGNPAAVCPLPEEGEGLEDSVLQKIALELNLSETAFIRRLRPEDSFQTGTTFGLRWFTPLTEVKLCGHATLASAATLFYTLRNQSKAVTFQTLSGDLIVKRDGGLLSMDFPTGVTNVQTEKDYTEVIKALGQTPGVENVALCESLKYVLIHLKEGWSRSEFEQWRPNMDDLHRATDSCVVLIVTTRGTVEEGYHSDAGVPYDFVSRCFAPWTGVPEDPVTGSAQTVLAHYWARLLHKQHFFTRQCSFRGGEITLRLRGDRVEILGAATTVIEGVLHL